jgi:hypothetical protein
MIHAVPAGTTAVFGNFALLEKLHLKDTRPISMTAVLARRMHSALIKHATASKCL